MTLDRGARGRAFRAVAEGGVPFRRVAGAIGRQVGVPAAALAPGRAECFGALVVWVAGNGPASSKATQALLGWTPRQLGLTSDIECVDHGDPAEQGEAL